MGYPYPIFCLCAFWGPYSFAPEDENEEADRDIENGLPKSRGNDSDKPDRPDDASWAAVASASPLDNLD